MINTRLIKRVINLFVTVFKSYFNYTSINVFDYFYSIDRRKILYNNINNSLTNFFLKPKIH